MTNKLIFDRNDPLPGQGGRGLYALRASLGHLRGRPLPFYGTPGRTLARVEELAGVSNMLVDDIRPQLKESFSSKRMGQDGRETAAEFPQLKRTGQGGEGELLEAQNYFK